MVKRNQTKDRNRLASGVLPKADSERVACVALNIEKDHVWIPVPSESTGENASSGVIVNTHVVGAVDSRAMIFSPHGINCQSDSKFCARTQGELQNLSKLAGICSGGRVVGTDPYRN